MGSWGQFGPCNKSCGVGHKRRQRHVTRPAVHGGKACPDLMQQASCHEQDCPEDCAVTEWGRWGECHSTWHWPCAQRRERKITSLAVNGGKSCPHLGAWRECNSAKCTVPKASGCDRVRCEFVQDDLGRGHVRVFHDQNEPKGSQHTCKKLVQYRIGKSASGRQVRKHHDTFSAPCDCRCYDKEDVPSPAMEAAV